MDSLIPPPSARPSIRRTDLGDAEGPIKVNRQLRELFREAFDNMGGAQWLVEFASANDSNARVFVQAISKLLPPSANPQSQEKIVLDIPWLTRERLEYKHVEVTRQDNQITDARVVNGD